MQILLVEDDQPTSAVLAASLRAQYYQVSTATDGETGLDLAQQFEYDLIVLDVELPKLDGIGLCQALRHQGNHSPVLLLTARDSTTDRILGLDAGADDYVIKPFDLAELLARVRALLRRGKAVSAALITWDNLSLDPISREVRVGEAALHLTPKEYGLLELFLLTPNRVFSRSAILDRLWNPVESPGEETVSTHIKCLRQKLEAAGVANPIKTIHGMGYRLRTPAESRPKSELNPKKSADLAASSLSLPSSLPSNLPSSSLSSSSLALLEPSRRHQAEQALAITTRVWQQSGSKLTAQIGAIEQAVTALSLDRLTPEIQAQAAQAAHKLAGSLGIFGMHGGSQLAKQLEDWLQPQILLDPVQADQLQGWVQDLYGSLPPLVVSPEPPLPRLPALTETASLPLVLIVLSDPKLAEQLAGVALTWGLRLETATPQTAQARRAETRPNAILFDLDWPTADQGLPLLDRLMQSSLPSGISTSSDPSRDPDCRPAEPMIILSAQDSLQNRLAVTHLGGVFLQKPASVPDIFHAITHVLEWRLRIPNRVMVVDDDPTLLTWISSLLQPFEIQMTGISDPEQFWPILQSASPDLLILDVELPILKGWQLCQMVRSDLKWQHLPVLFLSNDRSIHQVNRAFQAGADDYFYKSDYFCKSDQNSNRATELIERILRRLKRAGQSAGQISLTLMLMGMRPHELG